VVLTSILVRGILPATPLYIAALAMGDRLGPDKLPRLHGRLEVSKFLGKPMTFAFNCHTKTHTSQNSSVGLDPFLALWALVQKFIDLFSPKKNAYIDLTCCSVLPVRWAPAGSLPIDESYNFITTDKNVETTEVAMSEYRWRLCSVLLFHHFIDLRNVTWLPCHSASYEFLKLLYCLKWSKSSRATLYSSIV
jgi:hypothetical protein